MKKIKSNKSFVNTIDVLIMFVTLLESSFIYAICSLKNI